jgi:hypothetical protein
MPVYGYEIGLTTTTTNVEELTTPVHPPRGRWYEASIFNDKADGMVSAHGFPRCVWLFDILTEEMVSQLRTFVGTSQSGEVYIVTRVPPTAADDGELFVKFGAIMVWPSRDLMDKRNAGGRYLGVEIPFRRLEEA